MQVAHRQPLEYNNGVTSFEESYKELNEQQRRAVDHIEGPLLVIAGPGTGKTQLLSARVANILKQTDASAHNILCLTFTESGAQNMRERLRSFIGDTAYDVTIGTYHSFGSDIIKEFSEYFQQISLERSDDIRLERPIDELTQIQIVDKIVAKLPYDSPLLSARYYIKSIVGTISDLKEHLITPDKLRDIARSNQHEIASVQKALDTIINKPGGISRKKAEKEKQYRELLLALEQLSGSLIDQATEELRTAHELASETQSPTPLTKWKNTWLFKDEHDAFVFTDSSRNKKMLELAKIYTQYEDDLQSHAAYDFDDMILRAIDGIKQSDELRFNLQERFQYILLDEFQDTNPSQFELVKRLSDHPVHEGRPNIMAVGDDDQAIFAFQGANVGNMKDFLTSFRDVEVINLTHNYRSHADILHTAHNISEQIEDRLHRKLSHVKKELVASSRKLPKQAIIERHEFQAEASEYSWVAEKIKSLIDAGADPAEIAVLSPKHAILEGLVPFLKKAQIPVTYEKRENILETEIIQGLRLAAELLQALIRRDTVQIDYYFPLVLSLPFWQLPIEQIWSVNWQCSKNDEHRPWAEIALSNPQLTPAITFYLSLATGSTNEPLEITLDKLMGTLPASESKNPPVSPLKDYYFNSERRSEEDALQYFEAVSHLSVIRARLRDYQTASEHQLRLEDFLEFFIMHEVAEAPLINTHPVVQSNRSVQLMTAYRAKGLEFDSVFILQAHDDVWGNASRGALNKLSLPPNLSYVRYANSTDDERLRLLFVAITRARHSLYISSHLIKDTGKETTPIKYLGESDGFSRHLPQSAQRIIQNSNSAERIAQDTETLWQAGHVNLPADFKNLLSPRLRGYQMSPTHLNTFVDVEHGGPEAFLSQTLLRFPQAPSANGEFGTAIHTALEWYQHKLNEGQVPQIKELLKSFEHILSQRYMKDHEREQARAKGRRALSQYVPARQAMFERTAKAEVNFFHEGVIVGDAHLNGKIDRLEIDEETKTLRIVDYKTGPALKRWESTIKAHKYKQQLYFYKLLVEQSNSWRGYNVSEARLEFVEPDNQGAGDISPPLIMQFSSTEEERIKKLISTIWQHITYMSLPDTSNYPPTLKGLLAFEEDLLSNKI